MDSVMNTRFIRTSLRLILVLAAVCLHAQTQLPTTGAVYTNSAITLSSDSQLPQLSTPNKAACSAITSPDGSSADQGSVWAVSISPPTGGSSNFTADNTNNVVHVVQWMLPCGMRSTVSRLVVNLGTASSTSGCTLDIGVFSGDGNTKYYSTGAVSMDTTNASGGTTGAGNKNFTLGASVTLDGSYLILSWVENGCTVAPVFGGVTWGGGSTIPAMMNLGVTSPGPNVRVGTSANAASAGVLPATLGNITAVNTASGYPNLLMPR